MRSLEAHSAAGKFLQTAPRGFLKRGGPGAEVHVPLISRSCSSTLEHTVPWRPPPPCASGQTPRPRLYTCVLSGLGGTSPAAPSRPRFFTPALGTTGRVPRPPPGRRGRVLPVTGTLHCDSTFPHPTEDLFLARDTSPGRLFFKSPFK